MFANRTLNLRSVEAIGYDMDYTLIPYRTDELEAAAFAHAVLELGRQGVSVDGLRFEPDAYIQGLVIDLDLGNLLKATRFGYVIQGMHGTTKLSFDELRRAYSDVVVDLAIGDDANAIAGKINTELGLDDYDGLHQAATVVAAQVTLTAKSHGVHGNGILLAEVLSSPPGVTITPAAGAAGAGAPDLDAALQALGTTRYDYTILPDLDATNLADWITYANGLWEPEQARDSHAIAFFRGTVGASATFGLGEDTKHVSAFASPDMPDNPWVIASVIAAARWTQANPKASLYNDDLALSAPIAANRLNPTDRTTLLDAGIGTFHYVQDVPRVERFLTLAKTNDLAQASEAFLDAETKFTVSTIRQEQILRLQPEIGKILVADRASVQFAVGVGALTTDVSRIRQLLTTQYSGIALSFEAQGWVSDPSGFAADLIVEQLNATTIQITTVPRINGILYTALNSIEFILAA